MSTPLGVRFPAWTRAYPGTLLEVDGDGVVRASNGRLEARLERTLVGRPLAEALDAASRIKWIQLRAALRREDAPSDPWEMVLEGRDTLHPIAFHPIPDEDAILLVEALRDPRLDRLHEELSVLNSEQSSTQRLLAKEKARLARALDELEREFQENDRLTRALQQQNEEMEAQNEELLAMTEELHAGQEQLLQLNHQLERRSRELQLALSARNRFYAAMSHELRTPVNAVLGYNDLLLAGVYGPLTPAQQEGLERSQRAARHLLHLVNDVLDLSKLEAGKVELVMEPVPVAELVHDLLVTVRPLAAEHRVPLRFAPPDDTCTDRLTTDPRRVQQILLNLLSNALKYGGGNPVEVRCTTGGGRVVLEVRDGGPGIAPEDLERIFEEFTQLPNANLGGTGLGLPISKRLATLLGGTLEAESEMGVGSVFRLVLPTEGAPTPAA